MSPIAKSPPRISQSFSDSNLAEYLRCRPARSGTSRKRLGAAAIAGELNRRGLRTRTGKHWSPHTIRRLLTNPAYLAQVTFRDTTVAEAHPAIIDPTTFTTAEQHHGADAQRKALIELLVEEIQVIGPGPHPAIYRIPRRIEDEPAEEDGTTVRTMGNMVGDTGIEPVTPTVSR